MKVVYGNETISITDIENQFVIAQIDSYWYLLVKNPKSYMALGLYDGKLYQNGTLHTLNEWLKESEDMQAYDNCDEMFRFMLNIE